jgi:hypothetical protein
LQAFFFVVWPRGCYKIQLWRRDRLTIHGAIRGSPLRPNTPQTIRCNLTFLFLGGWTVVSAGVFCELKTTDSNQPRTQTRYKLLFKKTIRPILSRDKFKIRKDRLVLLYAE